HLTLELVAYDSMLHSAGNGRVCKHPSGKHPAALFDLRHHLDSNGQGGEAMRAFSGFGEGHYSLEGVVQLGFQLADNFPLGPTEALQVLHPFEIAYGNSAGVTQDVGD